MYRSSVLCSASGASAQNAGVFGWVRTEGSLEPVPFASVSVADGRRGVLTDEGGYYVLAGLPAGPLRLRITRIGYATVDITVTLAAGEPLRVDVEMQPAAVGLPEIRVVGDREDLGAVPAPGPPPIRIDAPTLDLIPALAEKDAMRTLEWYFNRAVRYSYQGNSPLPVEVQLSDTDEGTGKVVTEVWGLRYDQRGQLVEIRKGPVTETLTYDSRGDVIRVIRRDETHSTTFEQSLTYTSAWNPFARLPPLHGAFSGIVFLGEHSLHLSSSFENGVQGQPPAAQGTATVVTNATAIPPAGRSYE